MIRCIWLSRPGNGDKVDRIEKAGLLPRFFLDIIGINDILDISYIIYIKYINEKGEENREGNCNRKPKRRRGQDHHNA